MTRVLLHSILLGFFSRVVVIITRVIEDRSLTNAQSVSTSTLIRLVFRCVENRVQIFITLFY